MSDVWEVTATPQNEPATPKVGDIVVCQHPSGFTVTNLTPRRDMAEIECKICHLRQWLPVGELTKEPPEESAK